MCPGVKRCMDVPEKRALLVLAPSASAQNQGSGTCKRYLLSLSWGDRPYSLLSGRISPCGQEKNVSSCVQVLAWGLTPGETINLLYKMGLTIHNGEGNSKPLQYSCLETPWTV